MSVQRDYVVLELETSSRTQQALVRGRSSLPVRPQQVTPHVCYVLTRQTRVVTDTRPEHARETSRIPIADLAGLYERFTVLRKVPLSLGGRHARVIAIDGD
jgi:hypothetical protein